MPQRLAVVERLEADRLQAETAVGRRINRQRKEREALFEGAGGDRFNRWLDYNITVISVRKAEYNLRMTLIKKKVVFSGKLRI